MIKKILQIGWRYKLFFRSIQCDYELCTGSLCCVLLGSRTGCFNLIITAFHGVIHRPWDTISAVAVKQPERMWVMHHLTLLRIDDMIITRKATTTPCAYIVKHNSCFCCMQFSLYQTMTKTAHSVYKDTNNLSLSLNVIICDKWLQINIFIFLIIASLSLGQSYGLNIDKSGHHQTTTKQISARTMCRTLAM